MACPKSHFIAKFRFLLISADVSKIWKIFFCKNDPFNDVQHWSKFHVYTISQRGVIQKTSFADVSIFWFLPNILFWWQISTINSDFWILYPDALLKRYKWVCLRSPIFCAQFMAFGTCHKLHELAEGSGVKIYSKRDRKLCFWEFSQTDRYVDCIKG